MKALVEALCSDACAGRGAGTPGGRIARGLIVDALRTAGLDPWEQTVPGCNGANVLAKIDGDIDRWVIVAAHHDHLGTRNGAIYRGADDNAAAVGIMVDVATRLRSSRLQGRGVLFAAFDAEEPPYFLTNSMGSQHFVRNSPIPLDRIDMMVCLELLGHAVGPEGLPDSVRNSVFALGAERSEGTRALLDGMAERTQGLHVRRADAEVIPPLSDYEAFWKKDVPFVLLTNTRPGYYHTPQDTTDKLDWRKMSATSQWLEGFVRANCSRSEEKIRFVGDAADDAASLDTFIKLSEALAEVSSQAEMGRRFAVNLRKLCDANGRLPDEEKPKVQALVEMLEAGLG